LLKNLVRFAPFDSYCNATLLALHCPILQRARVYVYFALDSIVGSSLAESETSLGAVQDAPLGAIVASNRFASNWLTAQLAALRTWLAQRRSRRSCHCWRAFACNRQEQTGSSQWYVTEEFCQL
jgi:hypothetical protein